MARPSHFFRFVPGVFIVLTSFALGLPLRSQTSMLICESPTQSCKLPGAQLTLTWTFNGTEGTINSVAGSHLMIERLDTEAIIVHRNDSSGPTAGLSATYTGQVRGTSMNGNVEYTWPGQPGYPRNGSFSAQLQDQLAVAQEPSGAPASNADALPVELLVCENGGMCNGAWVLNGSEGTGTWFDRSPAHAKLTVLRSSPDDIRIRRTDTTDAVTAIYTGRREGDHYAGTIVWSTPGHPGEKTGRWIANVPQTQCNQAAGLNAAEAMRLGQNALMFQRNRDAVDCYIVAARDGEATAQLAVGLMYYQGRETVPQDYTQALFWLRKAADQGAYNAQRTVAEMYKAGQGTKRDPALSEIYTARADEQKHDFERRQDLEEHAADRRTQILSSFVLGASFGMFF